MQQREVLWHDTLHLVSHKHLIAVELDLVLLNLEVVVDFWEIENTRKVKRIVNVHMDVEQRLVACWVQFAVKCLVLLLGNLRRLHCPQRLGVVDDVILLGINILAILPLLHLAECNLHRQEVAILLQKLLHL